jgi:hypothetical protein
VRTIEVIAPVLKWIAIVVVFSWLAAEIVMNTVVAL